METHQITSQSKIKKNGYRPSFRNRWLLVSEGYLNIQEFAYFEFCIDMMDFDKNHGDYLGTFRVCFIEFANFFNCKSENTVRNWHKKLLELGLIIQTNENLVFKIKNTDRYLSSGRPSFGNPGDIAKKEKIQTTGFILQSIGLSSQIIEGKLQSVGDFSKKKVNKASLEDLGSSMGGELSQISKGNIVNEDNCVDVSNLNQGNSLRSNNEKLKESEFQSKKILIKADLKTPEEYEKIHKELNFKHMDPDDLRWIDEEIKNILHPKSKKEEIEIINLHFGGNEKMYKNQIIIDKDF